MKKKTREKIIILILMALVLFVLFLFLKDIFIPIIKMEIKNDRSGAAEFLKDKGILGLITVPLIEALQMVVIFIPAEFIQLTSGMTYPWFVALIFCDLGVLLGSSIIYFVVHVFKFNGDVFNRGNKIERYEKRFKSGNTMLLMYILFIMPIIPFGAICYYGANKKLPFHKYAFTCVTGVIPSIFTSIIMGEAVKEFIANKIPIYVLILIIILAAAILFTILALVLNKIFFKQNDKTPGSIFNHILLSLSYHFTSLKNKARVIKNGINEIEGPYLMLSNHHSPIDFNYIYALEKNRGMAIVVNEYYFRLPLAGKLGYHGGMIPKKMFTADINAVKSIMKAKNDGYPIVIFPEARLSTSGSSSEIDDSTACLAKKLNIPVVLVTTKDAYFYNNKWRKAKYRGRYDVEVKRIISKEEVEKMDQKTLHSIIKDTLTFNEFDDTSKINIKAKNKAEGLENILYMCPHCNSLYSNITKGNKMVCTSCNKEYNILPSYQFREDDIKNLNEYYEKIKEKERENIETFCFDVEVNTKIFKEGVKRPIKDKGLFHFDKDKIYYKSSVSSIYFEYKSLDLNGIAYSVNEEFEMYYDNDLYYFYPVSDKKVCTRIALVFELLKELKCNQEN